MKVKSGTTNVATSGTAVQLRNKKELVIRMYLSTPSSNTGYVFFGDSTVEGSGTLSGLTLPPSTEKFLVELAGQSRGSGVEFDGLYVDAATNGNKLNWLAVIQ